MNNLQEQGKLDWNIRVRFLAEGIFFLSSSGYGEEGKDSGA
jgi:hypothetical protein